jgi:hypothetical protein
MISFKINGYFNLCLFVIIISALSVNASAEPTCTAYQPYKDGCSDYGIDGNNFATDFEGACNAHDICYQTIGRTQSECDSNFRNDLLSSCEDKYLRFKAWRKIGKEKIIEEGVCFALLGPYTCQIIEYNDLFEWVEVAKELAERTIELPGYSVCLGEVPVYESAVRIFGGTSYEKGQSNATYHAEKLASNQLNGECLLYTSSDNSNLFTNRNEDVTRSLYKNILGREPSQDEYAESINLENTYLDWEYHLVKNNSDYRMIASLIPIISLILN